MAKNENIPSELLFEVYWKAYGNNIAMSQYSERHSPQILLWSALLKNPRMRESSKGLAWIKKVERDAIKTLKSGYHVIPIGEFERVWGTRSSDVIKDIASSSLENIKNYQKTNLNENKRRIKIKLLGRKD